MDEAIVIQWLRGNWLAFILAFIPPLIAEMKGRRRTRWYLYGLACTLLAWPLLSLPTTHVLLLRRRSGMSAQLSLKLRRADALALLGEDSVRSYPSWIAELNCVRAILSKSCAIVTRSPSCNAVPMPWRNDQPTSRNSLLPGSRSTKPSAPSRSSGWPLLRS